MIRTVRLVLGLVLLGGSALAQDVKSNYVPGTDFSKYKTYKWVQIEGGMHPDQIVGKQIQMAVDQQLAAKGFTKKTADPADMYVGYQVSVDQEQLIWRGEATKALDSKGDPQKKQKELDKAMGKLLKDFPPKPKS